MAQAMLQVVQLMQEQREQEIRSKECIKPDQLGTAIQDFPRWNLTRATYAAQRRNDWVYELDPIEQENHPNYPPAAPAAGNAAARAAAAAVIDAKRHQAQRDVHSLLIATCSRSYFQICTSVLSSDPRCGTELWRLILNRQQPDA